MRLISNIEASSRRSKQLLRNGRLNRLILLHGGVKDDFYNKLERLSVQAGKKDKILAEHVKRICEAHDTVLRSYNQQIHWSTGADAMTSMENIGEQVYV